VVPKRPQNCVPVWPSPLSYDRRALAQIRAVLETDPQVAEEELTGGFRSFATNLLATL
jgi:hypothetical protein